MINSVFNIIIQLVEYVPITLFMAISALILGLIFGSLLCFMKVSKKRFLRQIGNLYTTVVRGTPTIVLLFLSYYGIPLFLAQFGIDGNDFSKVGYSIIALSAFSTSTISEIVRPAFLSISRGQIEAGEMVGLSKLEIFFNILLPQIMTIATPNLGNLFISLIHETSLAYVIGVIDVMGKANLINNIHAGTQTLLIYSAVAIIFWLFS